MLECQKRAKKKWREENPDYTKNWRKKNPDKVSEQTRRKREKYHNDPEARKRRLESNLKTKKKEAEKINEIFGNHCIICQILYGKRKLTLHEIHGKKHPHKFSYYISHKDDFVRLCCYCHMAVHSLSGNGDLEVLRKLINYLNGFR